MQFVIRMVWCCAVVESSSWKYSPKYFQVSFFDTRVEFSEDRDWNYGAGFQQPRSYFLLGTSFDLSTYLDLGNRLDLVTAWMQARWKVACIQAVTEITACKINNVKSFDALLNYGYFYLTKHFPRW